MKPLTCDRHNISYFKIGEAQPVLVLLHGFCERKEMWLPLADALSPLATVIGIDLPGYGSSDYMDGADLEIYAGAVHEVLNTENARQVVMVGHSMGGYVTLAFAEKYPTCIQGMGLFHSHPYADDEARKTNRLKAIELVKEYGSERYIRELFSGLFTSAFKVG
ncbi:MAG: alpha/beta hydrolase, partial [Cyclobacteriaceae bacterium]|nr:alpha/beta hydrolase [Cyclobacteriaceae bacterium]